MLPDCVYWILSVCTSVIHTTREPFAPPTSNSTRTFFTTTWSAVPGLDSTRYTVVTEPAEKALPLYPTSSHTCPRPVPIDCHGNPSSPAYKQSPQLAANYCQSTVTLSHWQSAVSTHFPQTFTTTQGLFRIGTKGTMGTTGTQWVEEQVLPHRVGLAFPTWIMPK